jgi:hydroxymethylpyrimidine kinase/phosphomethylpyrimidine kinase
VQDLWPFAMKYILIIAGSDSSGGAGIQADIKTITSLGAHALSAITALTSQNSLGVEAIRPISAQCISSQVETVVRDVFPHAVKVGMLYTGAAIRGVARIIRKYRLPRVVLDPVLRSSTGKALLEPPAVNRITEDLFPLTSVVTPNLDEAEILTGRRVRTLAQMRQACKVIKAMGPDVVITGGHLKGDCVDLLYTREGFYPYHGERVETTHTHGTGCVFSSALATFLAMDYNLEKAVGEAHRFTKQAIKAGYPCGRGSGVVRPVPMSR